MTARELFQEGKLDEAIPAALEAVKKDPTDPNGRYLVAELMCYVGDWDRSEKHLEMLFKREPQLGGAVAIFRQLLRAAQAREQFYAEGRVPDFIDKPTAAQELHLKASIALREGQPDEAAQALADAEEARPKVSGQLYLSGEEEPTAFDDWRDLDDLNACFLEVLAASGQYFWIPFEQIKTIEFNRREQIRDLLWRPIQISTHGGPEGTVYIPAFYAGSSQHEDDHIRVGRRTDWIDAEPGPVRGVGLRMFLFGERDLTINQLTKIVVDPPPGSADADAAASADAGAADDSTGP